MRSKFKLISLIEILKCRNSKMPFYFIIVGFIALLKSMTNEMNTTWKDKTKDDLKRVSKSSMRMKIKLSDLFILKVWLK